MKWIHIFAGLLAIAAGAAALYAPKGSALHRQAGNWFVCAMLVMTASAAISSIFLRPNKLNTVAAFVTSYLVCTAWLAVKQPVAQSRSLLTGFALGILAVGGYAINVGMGAPSTIASMADNAPSQVIFVFAALCFFCAALDARLLWVGHLEGKHRLARHLWRMCFAMLIATGSFFLGQAKVFPLIVRKSSLLGLPVLSIPVLLVLGTMLYWLARVLIKRKRVARSA